MKRTKEEIDAILSAEKYPTKEVAVAACQAVSDPGDIIVIHDAACEVDDNDEGCTCEPSIVVHQAELASA